MQVCMYVHMYVYHSFQVYYKEINDWPQVIPDFHTVGLFRRKFILAADLPELLLAPCASLYSVPERAGLELCLLTKKNYEGLLRTWTVCYQRGSNKLLLKDTEPPYNKRYHDLRAFHYWNNRMLSPTHNFIFISLLQTPHLCIHYLHLQWRKLKNIHTHMKSPWPKSTQLLEPKSAKPKALLDLTTAVESEYKAMQAIKNWIQMSPDARCHWNWTWSWKNS